jgi:hypothetical protein
MYKKIAALTLLTLLLKTNPALAEDSFPLTMEPEIKPKNYSIGLFYINSYTNDNKTAAAEYRAEAKARFLNNNGAGLIGEVAFQYLGGTNPAIISGLIPAGDAVTYDGSALAGYRFPLVPQLAVYPFLKGRAIVTRGRGGDNLYGPEIGAGLEWQIYPETTHLNIRYGLMIPLFHNYTGSPDTVPATKYLLNEADIRLSYRFLENWDVIAGYQFRQFPQQLGNSKLSKEDLLFWNGVQIGVAFVF